MNEAFRKQLLDDLKKIDGFEDIGGISQDDNDVMNELLGFDLEEFEKGFEVSDKRALGYKKIDPHATTPKYNYPTDSGFDLHSIVEIVIPPFGRALIPTGLKFDIDEGYELQVRTKSGLAINHGLIVLNSPGTVDCGYTGEVQVIVFNTNQTEFIITKGMKVAQAVLSPVVNGRWVQLMEVENVIEKDRGDNGFGSTGIK
jgi:dUTP pyrophosphatase